MNRSAHVVLVHGRYHSPKHWTRVTAQLSKREVASTSVELPFTGWSNDIKAVRRAIDSITENVVLCGHSYGGRLISSAVGDATNVVHLVYLAAIMIENEETRAYRHELARSRPGIDELTQAAIRGRFYNDCTAEDAAEAIRLLRSSPRDDDPPSIESGFAPWIDIPSTYIVCTDDNAIDVGLQRQFAAQAKNQIELATSHSPFWSRPELVASILQSIATW